eukprot:1626952-Prymnesium_polylepis.1
MVNGDDATASCGKISHREALGSTYGQNGLSGKRSAQTRKSRMIRVSFTMNALEVCMEMKCCARDMPVASIHALQYRRKIRLRKAKRQRSSGLSSGSRSRKAAAVHMP